MLNIKRPMQKFPMSEQNRAAQFGAFAALTGYGEIIDETAKINIAKYDVKNTYISNED